MSSFRSLALVVALLALSSYGCGSKTPPAPNANAPAGAGGDSTTTASPRELTPAITSTIDQAEELTSGEYYEFCKAMEAEVQRGDAAAANARIDMEAIIGKALEGLEVSDKNRAEFMSGVKQGMTTSGLGHQIVNELQQGGMWKFLRVHKQQGRNLAWFRMKGPAGLNYHHLVLTKNNQGEIKVTDLYIMVAGEMMSSTLRRGLLPVVASTNRSALEKLVSSESEYVKSFPKIVEFQNSVRQGQYAQALTMYAALPESVQQDKTMIMLRLKAASQADDIENYKQAVALMQKLYPGEPNADLLNIDSYCLQGEFDKALAALDRIDKAVGGDPYLDDLRASIQVQNNKLPEAKALATKATQLNPPSLDAYWVLVTIALQEKDHAATLELLKAINQKFMMEFADMTTLPEYADFVKSPQYQDFQKAIQR